MTVILLEGGCQCGQVRYRIDGELVLAALCHCTMCRRAHAAPTVAWAMFPESAVSFLGSEPAIYESSPGCRRGFCSNCGTQVSFTADFLPDLIDVTIGSLDEPGKLPPSLQYWDSERLPWIDSVHQLPRFAEFPPSGEE